MLRRGVLGYHEGVWVGWERDLHGVWKNWHYEVHDLATKSV